MIIELLLRKLLLCKSRKRNCTHLTRSMSIDARNTGYSYVTNAKHDEALIRATILPTVTSIILC